MADNPYVKRITSWHNDKPLFCQTIALITQPLIDNQTTLLGLAGDFDLDDAVGVQLDAVGLWVGMGRTVNSEEEGVITMDDDTYRMVLRVKIQANHWDGTMEELPGIYAGLSASLGATIFAVDNFDMTMDVFVSGTRLSPLMRTIIAMGLLDIKPEGVRVRNHIISSETGVLFGFDISNDFIDGFDKSVWGENL
ncbi:DUF2612 domain-containing protein [Enterobacter sp. CGMCC 5087]|uniref:DUF2612 domain-containing protein n=1 Tax=Enterobacter sp. CGMCC 5087 TaxID=2183878 RepID=UPI000D67E59A|nr:DUF2612 domain-containing protein [Enterobacter sp. CGMCC 5087]PWI77279.1 DUF2612 domain-containing protein [Enterobacter sp. CGMCC 5087]